MSYNQILYPCNTPYQQLQVAGIVFGDGKVGSGNIGLGQNVVTGPPVSPATTSFAGSSSIFIGNGDRKNTTTDAADNNIAIGEKTLNSLTSGANNTAIGHQALLTSTIASNNVALGYQALTLATTGGTNTALGASAGNAVTTGTGNTLVGEAAGQAITTGVDNTVIGSAANSSSATGARRIAIGASASCTADDTAQIGDSKMTNVRFSTVAGQVSLGTASVPLGNIFSSSPPVRIGSLVALTAAAGSFPITLAYLQAGFIIFTGNNITDLQMPTPGDLTTFTGGGAAGASCSIIVSNQMTAGRAITLTANGLTSVPVVGVVSTSSATVFTSFTLYFVCTVATTTWVAIAV